MTPTEFVTAARRKYNAVGNNFYSDSEILDLLYQCEMELAKFALTIENVDTSISTVAGTRAYDLPSETLAIKRVVYDGVKLQKISFTDDDELTYWDESNTSQGTPYYYALFSEKIYLRPIPDAVNTLTIYRYKEPSVITVSDTIETPTRFHMDMVDGVVAEMMYKDLEAAIGDRYRRKFESNMLEARKWQQRRQRTDGANFVKTVSNSDVLGLG